MGWAYQPVQEFVAPRGRIVCATMRLESRRGRGAELSKLLARLSYKVLAEERGCLSYVVTRALGSRTQFVVHARFSDWRSFRDHGETAHLEEALPRVTSLLATPVSVEIFLEV